VSEFGQTSDIAKFCLLRYSSRKYIVILLMSQNLPVVHFTLTT